MAWLALAGLLAVAVPPVADAQTEAETTSLAPAQEARALALESDLRCPVCRSQSIRQSRSFMAEDMKRRLRELIQAGQTDAEIRAYFVARYGEWILLTPPRSGFNLAAYLPLVAVAGGAFALVWIARRWRRSWQDAADGGSAARPAPPPASPRLTRLEREIEETR